MSISSGYCACEGQCGMRHGRFAHCDSREADYIERTTGLSLCKACFERLVARQRAKQIKRDEKARQLSLL